MYSPFAMKYNTVRLQPLKEEEKGGKTRKEKVTFQIIQFAINFFTKSMPLSVTLVHIPDQGAEGLRSQHPKQGGGPQ